MNTYVSNTLLVWVRKKLRAVYNNDSDQEVKVSFESQEMPENREGNNKCALGEIL